MMATMPAPLRLRTPQRAGQVLALLGYGWPENLFMDALAAVTGEIEGELVKAGNDRGVAVRLASVVHEAACQEWRRLHAFPYSAGGHA